MPLMTFSIQHGRTGDEACRHLETAVHELTRQCGALITQVAWSTDRRHVRLEGRGFWVEMRVDAQAVHVAADLPLLGRLLGNTVTTRLQEILQRTVVKPLPKGSDKA